MESYHVHSVNLVISCWSKGSDWQSCVSFGFSLKEEINYFFMIVVFILSTIFVEYLILKATERFLYPLTFFPLSICFIFHTISTFFTSVKYGLFVFQPPWNTSKSSALAFLLSFICRRAIFPCPSLIRLFKQSFLFRVKIVLTLLWSSPPVFIFLYS